jgi:multicomponent Na+:H+ antiporter subunit A
VDAIVAIAVGGVVALVLLAVSSRPPDLTLTRFFEMASVPEGYGRNIVNVILVDFRAFDTLGEVVVVLVAALAGWALLRHKEEAGLPAEPHVTTIGESVIVKQSARMLMVLMLLFAVFMLLRGHNEPGGGFIGGLLGATAFSLVALGSGASTVRQALRIEPQTVAAVGLSLAVVAAVLGMVFGEPFLTAQWTTIQGIKVGTPLLFDAGVSLVVVGMMLTFVLGLKGRR